MAYNYGNYYGNAPMNGTGYSQQGTAYNYAQQPQMMDGYQRSTYQPQPQMSYQAPAQNQSIIWVQGEAGAKAYPVAAGQSVLLMDSEYPVLYVKSTDMTGRPLPMESYDLVKRDSVVNMPQISQKVQPAKMSEEYVKKSDLESTINEIVEKAVDKALSK